MPPQNFFENSDLKLENSFRGIFLFLDFDGTLVPIQDNPAHCVLSPNTKHQLETIYLSGKVSIAVLSGRNANDVKKRVQVENIYYGGNHGLEITGPNLRYVHPDALQGGRIINKICRKIEKEVGDIEGALIEKKKFGFTLHYRMAKKDDKALIQRAFQRVIAEQPDAQTVAVKRGKKVLELAPNIPWDKGKAALFVIQELKSNYLPIYVGDDATDEAAFKALSEDGPTIRVGRSKKTAAKYYLKGQWEVPRFLKHIHKLME
jgi:trehalose-phosphatase